MKSPYVKELGANQTINTFFLVQNKDIRQKKSGEPYLSLILCDRTGELDAKMWDNVAEVMETFDRDDFVKIKGLIQIFHNRPQLTIHKLRRVEDGEVDFADFFPASERNLPTVAGMTNIDGAAVGDNFSIDVRSAACPGSQDCHFAARSRSSGIEQGKQF